jgi:hypothetical protein
MLRLPKLFITDQHINILRICNVMLSILGCIFFDVISTDEKGSSSDLRYGLLKSLLTFYSSPLPPFQ